MLFAKRLFQGSALVAAALTLGGATLSGGCKEQVQGPDCEAQGGIFVEVDGKEICEEKCRPEFCLEGNVCVGNRCKLVCDSHLDCYSIAGGDAETQACTAVKQDSKNGLNDGADVLVCDTSPKVAEAGVACPKGDECGGVFACPDGSACDPAADGACPAAECKPMVCRTTGPGDADAYCTTVDCKADTDCAPGFYCGVIRLPNNICGTDKGEEDPCVDPSTFSQNGATFQEGPVSLIQNACLKRDLCAPCVNAVDCSLRGDFACVQIGATTNCAKTCLTEDDCPDDYNCAAAAPPTPGYCVPGTGSCEPPATNNFCHPCLNDLDCGPPGADNTVACIEDSVGQGACFDTTFPDTCTTDADCPESPSGRPGECLDEGEGLTSADQLYHRCYLPFFSGAGSFQCWNP
jgi:hypothetical protein